MATVVDLNNVALGLLGDRATLTSIDPPEGSAQADHCARFWPIARDEALASEDWQFASTYATVVALDEEHEHWTYVYTLPADCLIVREGRYGEDAVFAGLDPVSPQFEMSTNASGTIVLLTHADVMSVRYTRRVTNPTRYPPKLVTAMAYLLASYLAGPIVKGKAGVQMSIAMRQMWDKLSKEAAVTDANQGSARHKFVPGLVRARGARGEDTIIERGQYRYSLPFWAEP
jgi:hypothetical protein